MNHIYSRRAFLSLAGRDNKFLQPTQTQEPAVAKLDLDSLKKEYKKALFDRFFPNMDKWVVDHENGGFMCDFNIDKRELLTTHKKVWSEGRGIWVYAHAYNTFGRNQKLLETAQKSVEFILKNQPVNQDFWPASYSKEGKPLTGPGDIYGNLYLAEGLAAFAKATENQNYFNLAKRILLSGMQRYDSPNYSFDISYGPSDVQPINAPRVLGHWMVFLRSVSQLLQYKYDEQMDQLSIRCIEAIMNHHLNSKSGLMIEGLNHDFQVSDIRWTQFCYFAIAIQTLWIVMAEAFRRNNRTLFLKAADVFKRHLQLAIDPVYGGFFRSLDNVSNNQFKLDKVLSLQEEVLIGSLMYLEHVDDPWMRSCFIQTFNYIQEKFSHPEYAFIVESGNRTMSEYSLKGVGNYHHPRHLLLNLEVLERMIKRNGSVSGWIHTN